MIVRENIDFVRGQDPRDSMRIGSAEGIIQKFRKFRKFDEDNLINHWYVDRSFNSFYVYVKIDFGPDYTGDPDEEDKARKNSTNYVNLILSKADLDQYFSFVSNENPDEICYKIIPKYQDIFKKIAGELNR